MKHPHYIVAFNKKMFGDVIEGIQPMNITDLKDRADKSTFIGRRHELETNEEFGQALPYIILTNSTGIFTYQRTKQIGEERLAGKKSIGIGGHIDAGDVKFIAPNVIYPMGTLAAAITREVSEELVFMNEAGEEIDLASLDMDAQHAIAPMMLGIINDTSDEVGRVHYGIFMSMRIPDNIKVRCREDELTTIGFIQQPSHEEAEGYESWSKLVIEFLYGDKPQ